MNEPAHTPAPEEIRAAVATVARRTVQHIDEVPDLVLTTYATDSQRGAVGLLRVLLTGADRITEALASGDDDAVDSAVSSVAGDPLLRDLTRRRPGDAGVI